MAETGVHLSQAKSDGATRLHFVYDAWNRLTAVWEDDGDGTLETGGQAGDDAKIAEYQYDGRNFRVVKLVAAPKSVAPAAWNRTDFYYNENWQVLEERQARDVSPANKGVEAAAVHVQWAWDIRYIDAAVLRWRDGNLDGDLADAEDDTLYYCNDANMNVTALIDAATGAAVERYIYDPYGRVTFLAGDWTKTLGPDGQPNTPDDGTTSNYANEVLYCGYRFDSETGLNHVRHRMFSPTTGGWISRDPLQYVDGFSLYLYAFGAPTHVIDPFGTEACTLKKRICMARCADFYEYCLSCEGVEYSQDGKKKICGEVACSTCLGNCLRQCAATDVLSVVGIYIKGECSKDQKFRDIVSGLPLEKMEELTELLRKQLQAEAPGLTEPELKWAISAALKAAEYKMVKGAGGGMAGVTTILRAGNTVITGMLIGAEALQRIIPQELLRHYLLQHPEKIGDFEGLSCDPTFVYRFVMFARSKGGLSVAGNAIVTGVGYVLFQATPPPEE